MNNKAREFDIIAGSRIKKIGNGIPLHVAIGNKNSITFRNKMRRLGLKGEVDSLVRSMMRLQFKKHLKINRWCEVFNGSRG